MENTSEKFILKGTIVKEIFFNEDKNFGIWSLALHNQLSTGETEIVLKGTAPKLFPGEFLEVEARMVMDPQYGKQFVLSGKLNVSLPNEMFGMHEFISSGFAKGIGSDAATKLIDHHGTKIWKVLESIQQSLLDLAAHDGVTLSPFDDSIPEYFRLKLLEKKPKGKLREIEKIIAPIIDIPGLGKKKALAVILGWMTNKTRHENLIFLYQLGISPTMVKNIWNTFGNDLKERILDNPYLLCSQVENFKFSTADEIALRLGFRPEDPRRICAGLERAVDYLSQMYGHTGIQKNKLVYWVSEKYLHLPQDFIMTELNNHLLTLESRLVEGMSENYGPLIYPASLWHSENIVVDCIGAMLASQHSIEMSLNLEDFFKKYESEQKITLDESQKKAVLMALESKVGVITGGPGTGKTTIIRCLISAMRSMGKTIALCAPTGKAAKRMQEATGYPATTIHRLIGLVPGSPMQMTKIAADCIIVDESSMIDLPLLGFLMTQIPETSSLLFVGDARQLPSVGPGAVLEDLLACGLPKARLTLTHRQEGTSSIITNAHIIDKGAPYTSLVDDKNFMLFTEKDSVKVKRGIENLISKLDGDIQVLTPMKRGTLGTHSLNILLQKNLNPESSSKKQYEDKLRNWIWREQDKVMCVKNDHNNGIYNGEQGTLVDVDVNGRYLSVLYPDVSDKTITYSMDRFDEVIPAYVSTIHKSQGSEYQNVAIVLSEENMHFLERRLLYTAVTRAKKRCFLFAPTKVLAEAINTEKDHSRTGMMCEKLRFIISKTIPNHEISNY